MDFVEERTETKKKEIGPDIFEHSSRVEARQKAAGADVPYDTRMDAYEPAGQAPGLFIGGYQGSSSQGRLHPNARSGELHQTVGEPPATQVPQAPKKKAYKKDQKNVWEVLRKCTHCRREVDRLAALNLIS